MTEARWKHGAFRVTGRMTSVAGELVVEGDVLHFRPTPLEQRLRSEPWSIPLADVTGFRVAPLSPLAAFAGGLRPRLALDEGRSTTHLFIVKDPATVAKELLAVAVGAPDGNDGRG